MNRYTLNRGVFIDAGTLLGLSEAQARPRVHQLTKRDDGLYETTAIVNFKAGEVIAIAEPPKRIADAFDEVVDARPSARAERKPAPAAPAAA